jgi:hypothetical protein
MILYLIFYFRKSQIHENLEPNEEGHNLKISLSTQITKYDKTTCVLDGVKASERTKAEAQLMERKVNKQKTPIGLEFVWVFYF